jgi:carboxypeptidase Q
MWKILYFVFFCLICFVESDVFNNEVGVSVPVSCNISINLKNEIQSYAPIANKIIKFITNGKFKGKTWQKLSEFVDTFGSRIAGSKNLENAIDYMLRELKKEGLENVHGEAAQVPHWVR